MKPRILLPVIFLSCVLLSSCSDSGLTPAVRTGSDEGRGILFHMMTKAGVPSPSGFCVTAMAEDGSTVFLNEETYKDASGDEYLVGGFWADSPLSFYAVSPYISMTPSEDGITINAGTAGKPLTGTEDILTASAEDVQPTSSAVPLTFNHALARLQDIVLTGDEDKDVTFTVTSLSFSSPLYGSLEIISGEWISTGDPESRSILSSSVSLGTEGTDTLSVNLTAIPCTSTLRVTYSAKRGEFTNTYSKHATFSLTAGYAAILTLTLTDDADPLILDDEGVTLVPWDDGGTLPVSISQWELVVAPEALVFPPEGGMLSFVVSAEDDWTLSCDASWITIDPTGGSGTQTVYVTAEDIDGNPARDTVITVSSAGRTATVTVQQTAGPELDVEDMDDNGGYIEEM